MKRRISFLAVVSIIWGLIGLSKADARSFPDVYTTSVTFPAGYNVGDCVEFVSVAPIAAGASGFYEISLAYTRGSIAAAATHLAAISHSNPSVWREVGRINNNQYVDERVSFTIDCNTDGAAPRFRVRAVATHGVSSSPIIVYLAVTSKNYNANYNALSSWNNDVSVNKFLPMTNDWDLYVGNLFSSEGASLAIKALQNGNVGIGTSTPKEKLSVNGKIRAHEVKVEITNWPDYVFRPEYRLPTLEAVEEAIKVSGHLPGMPSAKEVEANGLDLGEMNKLLLKKIEELTLHLIELKKENIAQQVQLDSINQNYKLLLKNNHAVKH